MSHSRPNRRGSDRKNGLRHSRSQSIVFRLLWAFEFVDFSKNSVVPLSNEFSSQVIVILFYFFTMDTPLTPKNAIFVVFAAQAVWRSRAARARSTETSCETPCSAIVTPN